MLILWLTVTGTILANIYITKEIARSEFKNEHFNAKTQLLAEDAVKIYENEGVRSLRQWYRQTLRTDGLNLVLIDERANKLGARPPKKNTPDKGDPFTQSNHFDKHLLRLADQHVLSDSGERYTLRVLPSPALRAKFSPETLHVYRLLSSFVVIFIGSFWLYRSIAKPLKVLHDASEKLSNGDFSIRTMPKVGYRKDELGQLAQAFDHMAIKIEALLTNQQQLFRDISHEIRTPLTRQKLAIELARDSQSPEIFLDKIEHQNNNINALIHNLLTFIKLEDTDLKDMEVLDLAEVMTSIVAEAELDLAAKHISVHSELEGQCLINGNPILISRALENIFMNAVKYSPMSGKISISISRQQNIIQLVLCDQGPGIPEQDLKHILKPFYRSDQSRNQQTGGFGLGLAITQKIIQQHQAYLKIENAYPTGLTVTIDFHMHKPANK